MTRSVEQRVAAILARATDRPADSFSSDTALASLGFGSLDQIECMLAIEDEFQVEINESDARALKTAGDVVAAVTRALAARQAAGR